MGFEFRLPDELRGDSEGRKPVYARVAAQIIADMERAMYPDDDPPSGTPDLAVDIKLMVSQMTSELAVASERPENSARTDAEEFFRRTGARFRHENTWALYDADEDVICRPAGELHKAQERPLTDIARALVHWTRHESRLDRRFALLSFGTEGRAREGLVAEFGAAFLAALLEIAPEPSKHHAAEAARWLRTIKSDRRIALSAAIKDAETAVEYLHFLQRHIVLTDLGKASDPKKR